jgi:hypothetical protein
MKNKSLTYTLVFVVLTLGFLFCFVSSFLVLEPSGEEQSTFPAGSGFALVYSIILIVITIPIWTFLYITAGLTLKKYYQQKKSIAGNIFLILTLIADGVIWYLSVQESNGEEPLHLIFIPPVLLAIGIYLIFSTQAFDHKSQQ